MPINKSQRSRLIFNFSAEEAINILKRFSSSQKQLELKFHMKTPLGLGNVTKMAALLIFGKNTKNLLFWTKMPKTLSFGM